MMTSLRASLLVVVTLAVPALASAADIVAGQAKV
jgi:hypothetical protein